MTRLLTIAILLVTVLAGQQKYTGPPPAKQTVPYLIQAGRLVEPETARAFQIINNDLITYVVSGEKSTVRTPPASPVFVIESAAISDVEKLRLFRLEARDDHRTVTFNLKSKRGAVPIGTEITPVSESLFQIKVVQSLSPGEYAWIPDGANNVFCFQVF